jgi:hypothetical protein
VGRQSGQAQSPEHRVEPDLDSYQFESAVSRPRECDVGDPRESLPHDVDDLGVEHVANQQDLVVAESFWDRVDREGSQVDAHLYHDTGMLVLLDRSPRQQKVRSPPTPNEESLHHTQAGVNVEIDGQIGEATDYPAFGSEDIAGSERA